MEEIQNYEQDIKNGLVFIDVWANWCSPCRAMMPIIEQIEKEYPSITFYKMSAEIDENKPYLKSLGVSSIPMFFLFKDGKMIDSLNGTFPKKEIKNFIDRNI